MAECEDTITSDAIADARRIHLEKLTRVKDAVINVEPRTDATTRLLAGRWVDTMHDDGARKASGSNDAPQNDVASRGSWEAVSAFPGLKGAPRVWNTYSAHVLTSSMEREQSRYDGCLFYRLEPRREKIKKKAGRHIDDFQVTGLEPNVDRFLAQTRETEHARCSAFVHSR